MTSSLRERREPGKERRHGLYLFFYGCIDEFNKLLITVMVFHRHTLTHALWQLLQLVVGQLQLNKLLQRTNFIRQLLKEIM